MREILFRGKRKDNGKWIDGDYQKQYDVFEKIRHLIYWTKDHLNWEYFEVDPETVCQYTGLTDKNGRKIFEGDILRFKNPLINHEWMCVIEFIQGSFACRSIEKDGTIGGFSQFSNWNENEVIGNIFDNPELIGE